MNELYMIKKLFHSKWFLVMETVYLFSFPFILLAIWPDLIHFRLPIMIFGLVYVALVMHFCQITIKEIGFNSNNLKSAMLTGLKYAIPTLALLVPLLIIRPSLAMINEVRVESFNWSPWMVLALYCLISVPVQEVLFRGYMMARLRLVNESEIFLLVYSTVIFAMIHLSLDNKLIALFYLPFGWLLAKSYLKTKNILTPIIIHALVGGVAIYSMLA